MFVKGCFSASIRELMHDKINVINEVVGEMEYENFTADSILSEIARQYGVYVDVADISDSEYLSIDEESISLCEDTDFHDVLDFEVDCDFDIERFARDKGLTKLSEIDINARKDADVKISVSLEYIGEGFYGDYDENDEEDSPLMRFDIRISSEEESRYESRCTCLRADATVQQVEAVEEYIATEMEKAWRNGKNIARKADELSFIDDTFAESLVCLEKENSNQRLR